MRNATFYILDDGNTVDGLGAVGQLVCEITAERWCADKHVLITCENGKQALRLDEALWVRSAESFVPHNLTGEGPRDGVPVEIAWPEERSGNPHDLLVSLCVGLADPTTAFTGVVDFVPYEDSLKQSARDHYRAYRMAGFNLNTTTWK